MSERKINIAIVGLGFGAEFIPIYQRHPQANMYAICQRDPKKMDAVGDAFGVEKRYTDYAQLLKDPNVDAVHINSPIPDHGWMSIAALKAGQGATLGCDHANYTARAQIGAETLISLVSDLR